MNMILAGFTQVAFSRLTPSMMIHRGGGGIRAGAQLVGTAMMMLELLNLTSVASRKVVMPPITVALLSQSMLCGSVFVLNRNWPMLKTLKCRSQRRQISFFPSVALRTRRRSIVVSVIFG